MSYANPGLCSVCHREPRGFGWFIPYYRVSDRRRDESRKYLCSRVCQDLCHRRQGMINTSRNEQAAMVKGGQAGGRFLEQIGKTDLATLSDTEWASFVEHLVTGYCDHLRELAADMSECPF